MYTDKEILINELNVSKDIIKNSNLPLWEELPKIELYMDQVVALLNDYLGYISKLDKDEKGVTSSMINNYVKMKVIPAPLKKRYSRIHLSRLIMICSLKKSLNLSTVSKLLPQTEDEEENARIYNAFVNSRKATIESNIARIESEFYSIIDNADSVNSEMLTRLAVSTDIRKLITEKFTDVVFPQDEK